MDYRALEKLSYEQLVKEAQTFSLHPIPKNKTDLLEALVKHYDSLNEARSIQEKEIAGLKESTKHSSTGTIKKQQQQTMQNQMRECMDLQQSAIKHQKVMAQLSSTLQSIYIDQEGKVIVMEHLDRQENQGIPQEAERIPDIVPGKNQESGTPQGNNQNNFVFDYAEVEFLTSQIPLFTGAEDENVEIWIEKIETIAELHGISSLAMMSAAVTRLSKTARKWYDISPVEIIRSWTTFKQAILRMFERKVIFSVGWHKVDARKWIYGKESFREYALDKLSLMHYLKLSETRAIELLIGGIENTTIKALALSLSADNIDYFLEKMLYITSFEGTKESSVSSKFEKTKDGAFSSSKENKNTDQQSKTNCKGNLYCAFCHKRNHNKEDCFKLKKKIAQENLQSSSNTAAAVTNKDNESPQPFVHEDNIASSAMVDERDGRNRRNLIVNGAIIEINKMNEKSCSLFALLSTANPISFIGSEIYRHFFENDNLLSGPNQIYKDITGSRVNIKGLVKSTITVNELPNFSAKVKLHVLPAFSLQIILGLDFLDFLRENNISVIFQFSEEETRNKLGYKDILYKDLVPTVFVED